MAQMRRSLTWLAVALAAVVTVSAQSAAGRTALEAARKMEVVDGNLKGAIEQYKKLARDTDRAVAATALVRMAECYQKLGDAEAQTIYRQVLRDYADQTDAVAVARARLGTAMAAVPAKGDRAVWTGPRVDLTGRVSPDGRFLTFVDWSDGRLMLRDMAANIERALTPAAAPIFAESARWSAISRDGRQIVYEWMAMNGPAAVRIATLPASGFLEPRQFVIPNAQSFSSFDWSPDGKWIATAFERTDGTGEIGVIAVADGSFRRLKSVDRRALNKLRNPASLFVSLDGKYLAYDRPSTDPSQQKDVFVLAIEDGREIPVVVHGANDAVMGWAPDGTRLLFSSDRTGTIGLWAQAFAEGKTQGPPELLKSDTGLGYSLGVTGSGTLYLHKRISTRDIAIAPIDLEAGTLLGPPVSFTQGFGPGARNPAWSPDGKYLAYPVDCNNGCVAIRSVATGQVRRVAAALTESRAATWSRDGVSLLTKSRDARGADGIFQIDVQSGEAKPVISSGNLAVVVQWSPDGKRVYFNRGGMFVERDLSSGAERDVHGMKGERFGTLSPDGRYFAVARDDRATNAASLLLIPVAGGPPREVLRLPPSELLFRPGEGAWTPDGSAVLVQRFTGSRWELWLVPVAGDPPRKLDIDPSLWREDEGSSDGVSAVRQGDAGFSLSPDGRRLAMVTGKTVMEVWALENFLPAAKTPTR